MLGRPVALGARLLLSSALVLQLVACKGDEQPPTPAPAEPDPKAATDPVDEGARVAETAPTAIEPPPVEAAPTYAMGLDPLLDLVPAGQRDFVIVRDPRGLVDTLGAVLALQAAGLEHVAPKMPDLRPDELASAIRVMKGISTLFDGTSIDLDKGMLVLSQEGERAAVVYAAREPDALPTRVAALTGEKVEASCTTFEAAPGYVGCTDGGGPPPTLEPGKASAELRADLSRTFPNFDLERANVVARIGDGEGGVAFTLESVGAEIVLNVAVPRAADVTAVLGPGTPDLLALVPAGGSFVWVHASEQGRAALAASTPAMMAGVPPSLSGQALFGMLTKPRAMALVAGLKDPAPLTGLLSLAQMQLDGVPKTLPDGTTLEVQMKDLEEGGSKIKALRATFGGTPAIEQMKAVGFAPEAHAFVGPSLAGLTIGADEAAIRALAARTLGGPGEALLQRLPTALVRDLAASRVSGMMHLPLDGISTQAFAKVMEAVGSNMPPGPVGLDPTIAARAIMTTLGPLSSLTVWLRHDEQAVTARIAVQLIGDPATDEGRDALAAATALVEGKDSEGSFAALVEKYAGSSRASSYRIRAGQEPDAAIGGAFMVGVAATVAIPALTRYVERAKAAAIAP